MRHNYTSTLWSLQCIFVGAIQRTLKSVENKTWENAYWICRSVKRPIQSRPIVSVYMQRTPAKTCDLSSKCCQKICFYFESFLNVLSKSQTGAGKKHPAPFLPMHRFPSVPQDTSNIVRATSKASAERSAKVCALPFEFGFVPHAYFIPAFVKVSVCVGCCGRERLPESFVSDSRTQSRWHVRDLRGFFTTGMGVLCWARLSYRVLMRGRQFRWDKGLLPAKQVGGVWSAGSSLVTLQEQLWGARWSLPFFYNFLFLSLVGSDYSMGLVWASVARLSAPMPTN